MNETDGGNVTARDRELSDCKATPSLLHESMVAQSPDAMIFADERGRIRVWNARCEALFGFAEAEVLDRSLDIIIPERLRDAHWRGFRQAIADGRTRSSGKAVLTRAVRKDGGKLYVEMAFSVVVDSGGKVVGAMAVAREADAGKAAGRASPK